MSAEQNHGVSVLLSAKLHETAALVQRTLEEKSALTQRVTALENEAFAKIAKDVKGTGDVFMIREPMSPDAVRRLVARALGGLTGGEPLAFAPVRRGARPLREIRATRDIQQVQLALGFRCFGVHAPERKKYAANVFDCLMGRTMSSRLFQSVRERRGLSYDIRSQLQNFEDVGGWAVTAGLDTARVERAVETIEREFARIRARRPSSAELRRTKDYLLGNFRLGLENQRARMFFFGNCVQTYGRVRDPEELVKGIAAVTADDVLAVANEILDDRLKSVSWVTPKGA